MSLILDTHTLIWFLNGDDSLSANARKAIEENAESNFVSIASIWELAIKISLGRFEMKTSFKNLEEDILNNGFQILTIGFNDLLTLIDLPRIHGDPYDRIIISQAISNKYALVSKDGHFVEYPVELLW